MSADEPGCEHVSCEAARLITQRVGLFITDDPLCHAAVHLIMEDRDVGYAEAMHWALDLTQEVMAGLAASEEARTLDEELPRVLE